MNENNPYLSLLNEKTDDELFEVIENPEDKEELLFEAAVTIAHKRELISEYQATGLLEGDITVLDYNPNNLENQDVPYPKIEKPKKIKKPVEKQLIQSGLYLAGLGILLLILTYLFYGDRTTGWFSYIKHYRYAVSIIGIIVGLALLIGGMVIKTRKNKELKSWE